MPFESGTIAITPSGVMAFGAICVPFGPSYIMTQPHQMLRGPSVNCRLWRIAYANICYVEP